MNAAFRILVVLAVLLVAVPATLVFAPGLLLSASRSGPDNGPPLYAPNGDGVFPTEGQLGMANCAHPNHVADILAGEAKVGAQVCLENTVVAKATTDRHRYDATVGLFTVRGPEGGDLAARIPETTWWQHGTPVVGMVVVVEGTLAKDAAGNWSLDPVTRWVDLTNPGRGVEAWEVSAGRIPEFTYVWVNRTSIADVHRNEDGDDHIETVQLCPSAHLTTEVTPPYYGVILAPPMGATITMYGQVRYDDYHGWWEIHPIRAWKPLDTTTAAENCPQGLGESGLPPPGLPTCIPGPCAKR